MTRFLAVLVCVTGFAGACAATPQYKNTDAGTGGVDGRVSGSGGAAGSNAGAAGAAGGGGALVDTTTRRYDADDPNIQYTGRINFTNPKEPRFDVGGVSITARFSGTAVAVTLKEEFRYGKYVNSYQAVIDGQPAMVVVPRPNVFTYVIANALPPGDHQITLVKRTEAATGAGIFLGLSFAGEILPPPPRPSRCLEFIGDSITGGAGIDAANGAAACTAPPDGWGLTVENAYQAYGSVIGRALSADVHLLGISGIGLVRNYSNLNDARTMPQVYDLFYPELMDLPGIAQPRWDAARRMTFVPDAIVVGLGTNDFSPGDPADTTQPMFPRPPLTAAQFAAGHIAFVTTLRGYYPEAHIFLMNSPVLATVDLEAGLRLAVAHFADAGDSRVHAVVVPTISGRGCGTHPDAAQHRDIAGVLTPALTAALGW